MKPQRVPDLKPEELDARQKALFDAIAGPRGGVVRGPFAIWLRQPDLVEKANDFGNHLREGTSVAAHLSELGILVTARYWNASYEWFAHANTAVKVGVDPAVVEAIRIGATPSFDDPEQQVVYDLSRELYETKFISDDVYPRALDVLGQERTVDLVAILGFYTMVAMTLNAFHAPLPEGAEDPFGG
jgi:4-carboxymuconolactone decarboxylase